MIKIKDKINFYFGIIVLILSVALFIYSDRYKVFTRNGLGPGFAPKLVAVLAVVCAIFIIYRSFNYKEKIKDINKNNLIKTVIFVIFILLYISLLKNIDYLYSTALFLFVSMYILYPKEKNVMNLFKLAVISIIGAVTFSFVFENIFNIYL